jgi:hypothetical protein
LIFPVLLHQVTGCGDVIWNDVLSERRRNGPAESVYAAVYRAIQSRRPIAAVYQNFSACSVRIGWGETAKASFECFVISMAAQSETSLGPPGSSDSWRCVAVDKLSGIELLDRRWQTAPNHSRPASCIVDPDIDGIPGFR